MPKNIDKIMKLLIIDNYDSFTYNIVHAVRELGVEPVVARNDAIAPAVAGGYDKIIISPGPGVPSEAGIVPEVLRRYSADKSILGVCLGHQAIGERYGARLRNLDEVYHGVGSEIDITGDDYLFAGLPGKLTVGRYHSWVVDNGGLPDELVVTAMSRDGEIMAMRHREHDVRGVQFHPESILTPDGLKIFENFITHEK